MYVDCNVYSTDTYVCLYIYMYNTYIHIHMIRYIHIHIIVSPYHGRFPYSFRGPLGPVPQEAAAAADLGSALFAYASAPGGLGDYHDMMMYVEFNME